MILKLYEIWDEEDEKFYIRIWVSAWWMILFYGKSEIELEKLGDDLNVHVSYSNYFSDEEVALKIVNNFRQTLSKKFKLDKTTSKAKLKGSVKL